MDLSTGSSLPFGALSKNPSLFESLGYQITGFAVVFVALSLIWGATELFGLYFKKHTALKEKKTEVLTLVTLPAVHTPAKPESSTNGKLPIELVVAITAAVKVVLRDRRHKVHGIMPTQTDWAREGRRQIFASHAIR